MERLAYILRGVPGSGKTTLAQRLAGCNGIIHSTDDYFVGDDRIYRLDPTLYPRYHDRNFNGFCGSLDVEVPVVICDNTNMKIWHFARYIEAAEEAGYRVAVITLPHPDPAIAALRNVHNVSERTIRRMIRDWEPY